MRRISVYIQGKKRFENWNKWSKLAKPTTWGWTIHGWEKFGLCKLKLSFCVVVWYRNPSPILCATHIMREKIGWNVAVVRCFLRAENDVHRDRMAWETKRDPKSRGDRWERRRRVNENSTEWNLCSVVSCLVIRCKKSFQLKHFLRKFDN